MKTLMILWFLVISTTGFSLDGARAQEKEDGFADRVEVELKHIKKQIETLEKELKKDAKKTKENAAHSLEHAKSDAREVVKRGLKDVADGLINLEKKVRKMADEK
jgi:hypothetical protein